jgi:hypothetical protein
LIIVFFFAVAVLFPLTVLIGFGPTFLPQAVFSTRRRSLGTVIAVHGALMTFWVLMFIHAGLPCLVKADQGASETRDRCRRGGAVDHHYRLDNSDRCSKVRFGFRRLRKSRLSNS